MMASDNDIQPWLHNKEKSKCVKSILDDLHSFLKEYLLLANSQGSEFIVDGLWEKMVPADIQEELLEMSDSELALLPSSISWKLHGDLTVGKSRKMDLINDECKEYSFSEETFNQKHVETSNISENYPNLHCFVSAAKQLTLESCSVFTDISRLHTILRFDKNEGRFSRLLMSQKKSHEVDLMAELCSQLAKSCTTKLTVDLGSGKGYLSTQLCYQFHHHVVGIDASHTNTDGASRRAGRLRSHLDTQAKSSKQSSRIDIVRQNQATKPSCTDSDHGKNVEVQQLVDSFVSMKVSHDSRLNETKSSFGDKQENSYCCEKQNSDGQCTVPASSDIPPACPVRVLHHLQSEIGSKTIATDIKLYPALCCNNKESNISPTCKSNTCQLSADKNESVTKWSDKFVPVTKYVDCDMKLKDSIREAVNQLKLDADDPRILLTGLHTCGGLGSSILRLFVNSPSAAVLCNVACCYNLLEEEFVENPCAEKPDRSFNMCDFPMSAYLREKEVRLGKAARNIACLAVHRMATEEQLQGQSFYPRTLLQKIVKDLVGQFDWEGHRLRKVDKRSKSLYEYIRKCFTKLGLSTEKVTPELVESYDKRYSHVQHQLSAFVQLRAVLAPCIETFILLDRYLYLLEQETVGDVYITRLFDPVISPRCYAIIATKKTI